MPGVTLSPAIRRPPTNRRMRRDVIDELRPHISTPQLRLAANTQTVRVVKVCVEMKTKYNIVDVYEYFCTTQISDSQRYVNVFSL